jgi:hypothetical protein
MVRRPDYARVCFCLALMLLGCKGRNSGSGATTRDTSEDTYPGFLSRVREELSVGKETQFFPSSGLLLRVENATFETTSTGALIIESATLRVGNELEVHLSINGEAVPLVIDPVFGDKRVHGIVITPPDTSGVFGLWAVTEVPSLGPQQSRLSHSGRSYAFEAPVSSAEFTERREQLKKRLDGLKKQIQGGALKTRDGRTVEFRQGFSVQVADDMLVMRLVPAGDEARPLWGLSIRDLSGTRSVDVKWEGDCLIRLRVPQSNPSPNILARALESRPEWWRCIEPHFSQGFPPSTTLELGGPLGVGVSSSSPGDIAEPQRYSHLQIPLAP